MTVFQCRLCLIPRLSNIHSRRPLDSSFPECLSLSLSSHSLYFWTRPLSLPIRAAAEASQSPDCDDKPDKGRSGNIAGAEFLNLSKSPHINRATRWENQNLWTFKAKLDSKPCPEHRPPTATRPTSDWCPCRRTRTEARGPCQLDLRAGQSQSSQQVLTRKDSMSVGEQQLKPEE
ncbi:unnamed protein product, partial [Gulo gulo]